MEIDGLEQGTALKSIVWMLGWVGMWWTKHLNISWCMKTKFAVSFSFL